MRIFSLTLALAAAGLLTAACSNQGASQTGNKTSQLAGRVDAGPITYSLQTVADGLDHPWSIAFLPGGEMLVTQRTGKLLLIDGDGSKQIVHDFNSNGDFPNVHFGDGF